MTRVLPLAGRRALAGAGLKPRNDENEGKRALWGGQFCPQPAFSRLRRAELACAAKSGSAAGRVPAPPGPMRIVVFDRAAGLQTRPLGVLPEAPQ
jgi:hypothetical protein